MDVLSKLNAGAGIIVDKELTVSNCDESSDSPILKIANNNVELAPTEFFVSVDESFGVSLETNQQPLGLSIAKGYVEGDTQGVVKIYHANNGVDINTEFIKLRYEKASLSLNNCSDINVDAKNFNVDASTGVQVKVAQSTMDINTEFFKLNYGIQPEELNYYEGPTLKITANPVAGSDDPTAEISSQRLNISAFRATCTGSASINLRYSPFDSVDSITKEVTDHSDDNYVSLNFTGVDIGTPLSRMYLCSSGFVELCAASGITLCATNNLYVRGAAIHNNTSEFIVAFDSPDESARFCFETVETKISGSGISFHTNCSSTQNNFTIYTAGCSGCLTFEANGGIFANTNKIDITYYDEAGCITGQTTLNSDGMYVSKTTSTGSTIYGGAVLSDSISRIERMTQAEFDALEEKSTNTLYIIGESGSVMTLYAT